MSTSRTRIEIAWRISFGVVIMCLIIVALKNVIDLGHEHANERRCPHCGQSVEDP
jgi:hypothetical protein